MMYNILPADVMDEQGMPHGASDDTGCFVSLAQVENAETGTCWYCRKPVSNSIDRGYAPADNKPVNRLTIYHLTCHGAYMKYYAERTHADAD